jgi:hypothetical protein
MQSPYRDFAEEGNFGARRDNETAMQSLRHRGSENIRHTNVARYFGDRWDRAAVGESYSRMPPASLHGMHAICVQLCGVRVPRPLESKWKRLRPLTREQSRAASSNDGGWEQQTTRVVRINSEPDRESGLIGLLLFHHHVQNYVRRPFCPCRKTARAQPIRNWISSLPDWILERSRRDTNRPLGYFIGTSSHASAGHCWRLGCSRFPGCRTF